MRRSSGCLAKHELLFVLADEPESGLLRSHVSACSECRTQLEDLRCQLFELRALGPLAHTSSVVSNGPDPGTTSSAVSPASSPEEQGPTSGPQNRGSTSQCVSHGTASHGALSRNGSEARSDQEMPFPAAIGKYLVVGRFDRSGQAEVFRVVHPQFQRDLVLKLARLPIDVQDHAAIIAEGKHLAGLEHPNIVRVHDLDFHEGRPFLVMEYIRARTLTQYARAEKITPRRAAALIAELSGAVAFAHRRGIAHQDIKPANILIDETGRPRLIDFGLASQESAWSCPSTQSEGGTYAYMAPEQARHEPDRVRPMSDVFALGALLYFLLTGTAPFAAATPAESCDRARRCDFDHSALRKSDVPRRLERICLRAIAAEPAARYTTAEDFAADLNGWLCPPRWAVRVGATSALLLAGAASWWLVRPDPPHHRPDPRAQHILAAPHDSVPVPAAPGPGRPTVSKGAQYLVQVCRADQIFDLKDAVPLVTGDLLVIRCDLPRGLHASVFWFDTDGKFTELIPVAVSSLDTSDQLLYPPQGMVPLTGPPGTELVLICARRSAPVGREDVERLFAGVQTLPPLPTRAVVRWDRDELKIDLSRGVGAPQRSLIGDIQDLFAKIQRTSRTQFDFVAGVSFAHQDRRQPQPDPVQARDDR
jgi:eukaryotic-like serine/threonine-protein kinase